MQEIERANPDTLFRVFGAADWGNKEKFADKREVKKFCARHFSNTSSTRIPSYSSARMGIYGSITDRLAGGNKTNHKSATCTIWDGVDPCRRRFSSLMIIMLGISRPIHR